MIAISTHDSAECDYQKAIKLSLHNLLLEGLRKFKLSNITEGKKGTLIKMAASVKIDIRFHT